MAKSPSKYPTELELMILKILWDKGPSTIRIVRDALAEKRDLAFTSVMTVMNLMQSKGYLERTKQDGTYIYRPRIREMATTRRMLNDFVDRVFDGSTTTAMLHLMQTANLAEIDNIDAEIKELRKRIKRKAKKG